MKISFIEVMPEPLSLYEHGNQSLWGKTAEFNSNEKVLLNASSGKGKSTFTNCAVGLRNDYSGSIFYDHQDIRSFNPDEWAALRQTVISIVFQDLQLFSELTVQENLLIKNNLTGALSEQRIKEMLEFLEIESKWNQKCRYLSMGQQQRVAIIRALCQPFEMLLMDEPFSHLDVDIAKKCLELIDCRCDELKAGFILTTLGDDHGFNYTKTLYL